MTKSTRKKINVTEEMIQAGRPHNPCYCPVALSIKAEGFHTVGVTPFNIRTGSYAVNDVRYYQVPRSVQRFVRDFDYKKPVKPFSFFLVEKAYAK